MKLSKILCIIGLCIVTPIFILLLCLPSCKNKTTASAFSVEDNTLGYTSTVLDNGIFYFNDIMFDTDPSTASSTTRTVLPCSVYFSPEYATPMYTKPSISTVGGIYSIVGVYSTADVYSGNYFYYLRTDPFLPSNSNTDYFCRYIGNRVYSVETLYSALSNFEIGKRSNNTVNYKVNFNVINYSSTHYDSDNNLTYSSISFTSSFQKYISIKDYISRADIIALFDTDYNNNNQTYNNNVCNIGIEFTLYVYDPNALEYGTDTYVYFNTPIESVNAYNQFVLTNSNKLYNYTVINNPSPSDIIFNGVYNIFMIEVFPNFYLYYVIAIALGGVMVGMVLKIFLGG